MANQAPDGDRPATVLSECSLGRTYGTGLVEFVPVAGGKRVQFRIGDVVDHSRQSMID